MIAIEERPSPNHERRRGTGGPDMILLHYTGMPSEEAALDWLCSPRSGVSAHYQVFAGGRIVKMVEETRRAWHAGDSFWDGATDLNSRSIGIEITNPGHEHGYVDFPSAQIDAVIALLDDSRGRWAIADARILAHSAVASSFARWD
jgi:N-acetylmuramoyl-L-alanine amidase